MDHQPIETTSYSLSSAPPAEPSNRRESERHITLFRVGSLLVDGKRELCLIKNISAGGMMIRAYQTLAPDQALMVELKTGQSIAGKVSWVRDQNVGLSFDEPIDVLDVLSATDSGPRPRMPRVEVDCGVTLVENGQRWRVRLCDISQGGIKVACDRAFDVGGDVGVLLPGLAAEPGVVRWAQDGLIGVTFNRLLPLAQLVAWLRELREGDLRRAG